jgi:hypothetical protein
MKGAGVRGCGGAGVLVVLVVLLLASASAQDDTHHRIVVAVRAAMAPALPFPNSDADGALPANGNSEALWMVRPLQPGDRTIEVIANPLNEANQQRATRAMAQIENNIEAAQRRAALQYDRAVSEAKRTGRSQEVDGVTLYDEGVAGAKIDAESHVTIEVFDGAPSFELAIESSVQPALSSQAVISGAVVLATPSNTFRDSGTNIERYAEAQTLVFLGRAAAPEVQKRADHQFEVLAAGTSPMMVIRMRGNEGLIADLLRKTNWKALLELLP